jgi:hypothetical protein
LVGGPRRERELRRAGSGFDQPPGTTEPCHRCRPRVVAVLGDENTTTVQRRPGDSRPDRPNKHTQPGATPRRRRALLRPSADPRAFHTRTGRIAAIPAATPTSSTALSASAVTRSSGASQRQSPARTWRQTTCSPPLMPMQGWSRTEGAGQLPYPDSRSWQLWTTSVHNRTPMATTASGRAPARSGCSGGQRLSSRVGARTRWCGRSPLR